MERLKGYVNPLDILKRITRNDRIKRDTFTIIITGRFGPTGKTWLCQELCKCGYKAFELTSAARSLMFRDDDGMNHLVVDEGEKQVVVVLNEILPMYEDKWRKVSDFDSKNVYTFDTSEEARQVRWYMIGIADLYGVVTKADFKEIIGQETERLDWKYGWLPDAIRKSRVLRVDHGYFIEFPKALPIV
jgi:hypothetical protein